jgi:hypothetical protein
VDGTHHLKLGLNQTGRGGQFFNLVPPHDCSRGKGACFYLIKSLLSGTRSLLAGQKFPVRLVREFLDKRLGHRDFCVSTLGRDR